MEKCPRRGSPPPQSKLSPDAPLVSESKFVVLSEIAVLSVTYFFPLACALLFPDQCNPCNYTVRALEISDGDC